MNLKRRHLNSSQRAIVALEVERLLAVQAKERQVEAIKRGNVTRHQGAPIVQIIAPLAEEPPAKSRDAAAARRASMDLTRALAQLRKTN